jgi:hypothetical protein
MPVKRRLGKRRPERPTIDALLDGTAIEFTAAAHRELVNAVYFHDPELPSEAEQRGMALLAQWRAAGNYL